jgi:hypothetical protein
VANATIVELRGGEDPSSVLSSAAYVVGGYSQGGTASMANSQPFPVVFVTSIVVNHWIRFCVQHLPFIKSYGSYLCFMDVYLV